MLSILFISMETSVMLSQFEDQFQLSPDVCYLNHAAVSPWPTCTSEAVCQFANENSFSGAQHYPKWLKEEQALRENLKRLINADSTDEIALAKNTSEALSIIAYGIDWQHGDEVIISNQEFPSNRIVWESLSDLGVNLRIANIDRGDPVKEICKQFSTKTKLVSISSVQYANGLLTNLKELSENCKNNNTLLCVDAIQSLGAIPFDQQSICADFIVADGHKWLMSAEGLALLYMKKKHIESLKLNQFGWHMVKDKGNYSSLTWEPAKDATRFECGSPNMLGIHALNASVKFILEADVNQIQRQLKQRIHFLIDQLKTIKEIQFISNIEISETEIISGIVTFSIDGINSSELYRQLMEKNVICANRGGGIRFSPHFYTSEDNLIKAVSILKKLIQNLQSV